MHFTSTATILVVDPRLVKRDLKINYGITTIGGAILIVNEVRLWKPTNVLARKDSLIELKRGFGGHIIMKVRNNSESQAAIKLILPLFFLKVCVFIVSCLVFFLWTFDLNTVRFQYILPSFNRGLGTATADIVMLTNIIYYFYSVLTYLQSNSKIFQITCP